MNRELIEKVKKEIGEIDCNNCVSSALNVCKDCVRALMRWEPSDDLINRIINRVLRYKDKK